MTYRLNSNPIQNTKIIIAAGQSQVSIRWTRIFGYFYYKERQNEYPFKVFYSNVITKELWKLSNPSRLKDTAC